MKKILTVSVAFACGALVSYGQGTIAIYNSATSAYYISTNATSVGGGIGVTTTAAGPFYYGLLMATYGGAAPTNSPLDSHWSDSGASATNYLNGGIRSAGSAAGFAQAGWPLASAAGYTVSTPEYYMLVGWSANIAGANGLSKVLGDYASGNWSLTSGNYGFFGFSPVAYQVGGNPSASLNAINLLGNPSGITGAGLAAGFQLSAVTPGVVPEPATMALAALGGASLLMLRRKK